MRKKILNLRNIGLNSLEISKKLKINKLDIDLFLIENYYSEHKNQNIDLNICKNIIINRYNNISISNSCKKYNISDSSVSKKFKNAGIYFYPINYFDYSFWTKKNINKLIKDFKSGIPVYKLVDKYGFHKNALAKILKDNGIDTEKPTFDIHYFDKIDTEEKAYWLGFLYADGAISSRDNSCELSLQLLDAEHLYKFKNALKSSGNIRLDFKVGRCRFTVSNKIFKKALCNLGCTPKKSLSVSFKEDCITDKKLRLSFIRGYFDGDGCLTHCFTNTSKSRITVSTSFIGTKSLLSWIEKELKEYNINCTWYYDSRNNPNIRFLLLNKLNSVKLLNLIYTNAKVYLTRKYNKYNFFSKYNNFAVYVSDYIKYNRTISEKAKSWIIKNLCSDFDIRYANAEITKNSNKFLVS